VGSELLGLCATVGLADGCAVVGYELSDGVLFWVAVKSNSSS
jgi:hypothetical protein